MTMRRHALLSEMTTQVAAVLTNLEKFATVRTIQATSFKAFLASIQWIDALPAALVVVGAADYPDDAPAQRDRFQQIGVAVVGTYSADPSAGADDVWALLDAVDRAFTPALGEPPVTLDGVTYAPVHSEPLALGEDRSGHLLNLEAIDTTQERSEIAD